MSELLHPLSRRTHPKVEPQGNSVNETMSNNQATILMVTAIQDIDSTKIYTKHMNMVSQNLQIKLPLYKLNGELEPYEWVCKLAIDFDHTRVHNDETLCS